MNAQNLGFTSSWRMLTRDKGWIKPVLVLTLVGWIPILGTIALLGYALEWARLTAWGVDSAPKQRGVDYGKVLSTGGRAFLVTFSMGLVVALIMQIVFPGSLYLVLSGMTGGSVASGATAVTSGFAMSLLTMVVSLLMGTFLQAAALRATLYDKFSAGWRLDRLFQMVARDFKGFLKTLLVTIIGSAITFVYTFVVTLALLLIAVGGVMSATAFLGMSDGYMTGWHYVFEQLMRIGAGPLLLFLLVTLALTFVGGVITTAMSLVSINAVGQWFCRFDVNRWGVSSDPLPDGVPHRDGAGQAAQASPVSPAGAQGANWGQQASDTAQQTPDAGQQTAGVAQGAPFTGRPAPEVSASPVQPVEPVQSLSDAPIFPVVPLDAEEVSRGTSVVDEDAAREAAEAAARSIAVEDGRAVEPGAGEEERPSDETAEVQGMSETEVASKKPIPLGPVTSEDADSHEDGPIQA